MDRILLLTLVQGANGNLYGTTTSMAAPPTMARCLKSRRPVDLTIYNFCSQASCADGYGPQGGLVLATNGSFYGVTISGGAGYGTVFKITSAGKLTTLHSFNNTDGESPTAGLIQATDGNFYGTTNSGGLTARAPRLRLPRAERLRLCIIFVEVCALMVLVRRAGSSRPPTGISTGPLTTAGVPTTSTHVPLIAGVGPPSNSPPRVR